MTLAQDNLVSMKLVVIGDSYAGKSCLIRSYESGKFMSNYLSTIGLDFLKKKINLTNNKEAILNVWDTAGQERFQALTMNYLKGTDGILLCVALTDDNYIQQIKNWFDKVQNVLDETEIQILIVGTKCDLVNDRAIIEFKKSVASEFNNKYQCEITSAKQLIGVDKAFKTIANMIIKSKQELEALEIKSLREFKADKTLNNKEKTKKCC